MRDGFTIDPYRAAVGLASAAARRGVACFERSRVKKVRFTRRDAEVIVDGGTIRAAHVVIATGSATAEFKPLQRHFTRREAYLALTEPVPAAVRRQLGPRGTVLRDLRTPPHAVKWTADDRLLVTGADQHPTAARTRQPVLVQRTGQLMYELLTMYPAISGLQPAYGWEASYGETADGLMYIGAHRNYPHHLFALGGSRDSLTGAFVAARILVRALHGAADKADEVFAWTR
jgi:glycine/D-amino acid oxidase-like deaminating enzyme